MSVLQEAMAELGFEAIIVEPDGRNSLGGSFWANSPAIGKWRDALLNEALPYIDSAYRTIPDAASRGISGFSMGGYAAVSLAFERPDLFGAVYAIGPGLYPEGGIAEATRGWGRDFLEAYGAAFSADLSLPYPFARIPAFDGSPSDLAVVEAWNEGFGNPRAKAQAYLDLLARGGKGLRGILLEVGLNEDNPWILEGTKEFASILEELGIERELRLTQARHELPRDFGPRFLLPFFKEHLKGGSGE
jgi:pimeloyl-ACP methyl ester carboxylesterase